MAKYKQGIFKPLNPEKYIGDFNNIIYRSSWELKFMSFLDTHPDILNWASEEIKIPFISPVDKKVHRYFPDFFVRKKSKDGIIENLIIEIKPKKEIKMPVRGNKRQETYLRECLTYSKNLAKWEAAQKYSKANGMTFKIMTEEEIYGRK